MYMYGLDVCNYMYSKLFDLVFPPMKEAWNLLSFKFHSSYDYNSDHRSVRSQKFECSYYNMILQILPISDLIGVRWALKVQHIHMYFSIDMVFISSCKKMQEKCNLHCTCTCRRQHTMYKSILHPHTSMMEADIINFTVTDCTDNHTGSICTKMKSPSPTLRKYVMSSGY